MRHPHRTRTLLGGCLAFFLAGATTAQSAGDAQLDKYVALGDSLTAAHSNGGLAITQQADSYPALLARSFAAVGGGTENFEQPLVSAPGLPAQMQLLHVSPVTLAPRPGSGQPLNLNLPRPYDNLGVPGARLHDVRATIESKVNPYYDLVLRRAGTMLQQALVQRPTLVTLQIGNNDVLGAATAGLAPQAPPLTPVDEFGAEVHALLTALTSSGAQVAIANLPDVTTIPFFTALPPALLHPVTGDVIPLIGPDGPLELGDLVLLTASEFLGRGIGVPVAAGGTGQPLPDSVVLDRGEVAVLSQRVADYNAQIAAAAEVTGAVVVDVHGTFRSIVDHGLALGGVTVTADFLTGGLFSYDGVHPTRLGYGVLANTFLGAINDAFGAEIPFVDLAALAFQPAASGGAGTVEDAAVDAAPRRLLPGVEGRYLRSSARPEWTPFVFTREAWANLQLAVGAVPAEGPDGGVAPPPGKELPATGGRGVQTRSQTRELAAPLLRDGGARETRRPVR